MNLRHKAGSLKPVPPRRRSPQTLRALREKAARFAVAACLGSFAFLAAREASAQEWTKDRRFGDGKGYRSGDIEFHPGVGAEFGYDSNYFLRSDATGAQFINAAPNAPVRDGAILRITPSVSINTVYTPPPAGGTLTDTPAAPTEPPKIAWKLFLSGSYYEFFGPQELEDQRNVAVDAHTRVDFYPGRVVGGAVFVNYDRILKPAVSNSIPDNSFNRDQINAGAEVIVMPGAGTLDIRVGYQFTGELFEQSNGTPFTNLTHEIDIRDRWRFRPRTALFHDTAIGFTTYPNKDRAANLLEDSTPLTTRFGITGLVTPRFSALAAIGYGTTFSSDPASASTQQYDSVIGQAEATFFLSANPNESDPGQVSLSVSTLTFGYNRDFQKSFIGGGYYGSDRGYGRLAYFFGNRALVSLDANIGAVEYNDIYANSLAGAPTKISSGFTDIRVGSKLFGEYRVLDSLGVNATFDYSQNISSHTLNFGGTAGAPGVGAAGGTVYDMAWKRFQAFVGVRYFL